VRSNDVFIGNSGAQGNGKTFAGVSDSLSKNIYLSGNDFRNFEKPVVQKKNGQIILVSNTGR